MLRVNVAILNRRPGDIIREGDKAYEQFRYWADREDRKGGEVICEDVDTAEQQAMAEKEAAEKEAAEKEAAEKEAAEKEGGGEPNEELQRILAKSVAIRSNQEMEIVLRLVHGIDPPDKAPQKVLRKLLKDAEAVKKDN